MPIRIREIDIRASMTGRDRDAEDEARHEAFRREMRELCRDEIERVLRRLTER